MKSKYLFPIMLCCFACLTSCGMAESRDGIREETGGAVLRQWAEERPKIVDELSNMLTTAGYDGNARLSIYPFEFHMTNGDTSDLKLDYRNRKIMTTENVEVRGIPREYGAVNQVLSYQMVTVHAVVYGEGEERWALVSFFCFDAAYDDIGWVEISDLIEYTEENYRLLRYPVQVREGCVDLDTGETVRWDAFCVDYYEDYAVVGREGGRDYRVSVDDILYPDFTKE